ncbi:response regulator transcription factor [Rubellimicrobium rubrum]|uniref:Response regulator transcription factor n=1 Tax=Rubellimicrobium rubrum TaxID=2585369 RepID=A0A5C4N3A3_9RHOB|nr:response regulator transcription factor [Rubellimicrobium rubrum]TNC51972.1 response regulator transcription factor [Rubellimicrobium rubrum]
MARILLVEDDPRIVSFIRRGLQAEGHVIDTADTAARGLNMARENDYPLLILDRMLPDMDGAEICRQLRQERVGSRILMLTAKDTLGDKVGGLRAGADDYLTKPFSFDEFVARIEALLRRSAMQRHESRLQVSDLTLDPATRAVMRGGRAIELTPKEYALLRCLMENPGTVLSRSQLLNNVWGLAFDPGTKVVDVYVRYLRRKVDDGAAESLIHTARGTGYWIGQGSGSQDATAADS